MVLKTDKLKVLSTRDADLKKLHDLKLPGFEKIKPASINHTMCGVIFQVCEDTGLSSLAKQLILGDILENKIPDEKLFLK